MKHPYVSSTQVASSVPFDSTQDAFNSTDVQSALGEIRQHPVWDQDTASTTLNGTLTLTVASKGYQLLSGTATGFTVQMPSALTLFVGQEYMLVNTGSQTVNVKDASGTLLFVLAQTSIAYIFLQAQGSAAGTWVFWQTFIGTASGVVSYNIVSSTAFTTSSQTDVVITGFTVTPQAGLYAVWYNSQVFYTTTPKTHWWSIYKANSQVADTLRFQDTAHSNQNMADSTMSIIQFDGVSACDVRVRCDTSGSLTVNQRSLLLIRLGT